MFGSPGKTTYRRFIMLLKLMLPRRQLLQLQYFKKNLALPNLRKPETFTEKLLHRKLTENDDRYAELADKVKVKRYVADLIGEEYVIRTLWAGKSLPDEIETWKRPFVIKANHTTGSNIFIREGDEIDWDRVRQECANWLTTEFKPWLGERWYNRIDRQILVEEFIGGGGEPPADYKFFVFAGEVKLVQVDVDRFTAHRRNLYRPDWTLLATRYTYRTTDGPISPPEHLGLMKELAAKLGTGFDFVRVDFYDLPDGPKFGEMTFCPGSGAERFQPAALDRELGSYWPD